MTVQELRQLLDKLPDQQKEIQLVITIDKVPVALSMSAVVVAAESCELTRPYIVAGKPVGSPGPIMFTVDP